MQFAILCLIVFPIETLCGVLAFHTIGELSSAMLRLIVILNVFFLFLFATGARKLAWFAVITLALLIIPYHLTLGIGWWAIHQESCRIVNFANQVQKDSGQYPDDLSSYDFQMKALRSFISYRRTQDGYTVLLQRRIAQHLPLEYERWALVLLPRLTPPLFAA